MTINTNADRLEAMRGRHSVRAYTDKPIEGETPKIAPGSIVMTCFTSDFLLKDADEWRDECWEMIKRRGDCMS